MIRPDPDTLDIAELKRRDLEQFRARNPGINNDWFFGPVDGEDPVKVDVLGGIVAGTVFIMAIIGVFATVQFIVGLFL